MYCDSGSLCFELAKGLPAAFVALVVGAFAGLIAWRQYATAKAKLKLDLFDKRYAVFYLTWGQLSEPVQKGSSLNTLSGFSNGIPQARFLFGPEVETYLREIAAKRIELEGIVPKTMSSGGGMSHEDIERHTALMAWFEAQASKGVHDMFAPWLDLHNWK